MTSLIILIVLLLVVGVIGHSVVRNRKSSARPLLAKTRSFDPTADVEPIESAPTSSDIPHGSCALATALRIVGTINVFAAFILAYMLSEDFGGVIAFAVIISGGLGCLFCFALAKCVDAADKYLNSY